MKDFIIRKVREAAEKSEHKHRIGAIIFNKKIVYSTGRNYSCRAVKHLHPRYKTFPGSIHAEIDAVIKAKKDVSGCDILIIRLNKKGEFRYVFPCIYCMKYLIYVGIKTIYYSTNDGKIERFKI